MKVDELKLSAVITPKTTGYAAVAGLGLTAASGISRNKTLRGKHKVFAWLTTAITALHIGLIEYLNHKYKRKK